MTRVASPAESAPGTDNAGPQEQTTIDLTAPLQPGDPGAQDKPIDLTEDSVAVPDQPSRDQQQRISALERALEQANETIKTLQEASRRTLDEQEAVLTCPISYELFEDPVVTVCCGKSFSSASLKEVLRANPRCPVCRAARVKTHTSRDMANLVELHKSARSLLDEAEAKRKQDVAEAAGQAHTQGSSDSSRDRGNRERRHQRVQARSAVSRPQASRPGGAAAPAEQAPLEPPAPDWQDQYLWWVLGEDD